MLALIVVAAFFFAEPLPATASCAARNAPAAIVHEAVADLPPMALQQGIYGLVEVAVSLDEQGHLVGAAIQTSPSALLNSAALAAARRSRFRAEVRDCRPVATRYVYAIRFVNRGDWGPFPFEYVDKATTPPQLVLQADGRDTAAVTSLVLHAEFVARATDAASAYAADDAATAAFAAGIAALRVSSAVTDEYYNLSRTQIPAAPQGEGVLAIRGIAVALPRAAPLDSIVRALAGAGATSAAIEYRWSPDDPGVARAAAIAARDAENLARSTAEAQHLRATFVSTQTIMVDGSPPLVMMFDVPHDRRLPEIPASVPIAVRIVSRFALQP